MWWMLRRRQKKNKQRVTQFRHGMVKLENITTASGSRVLPKIRDEIKEALVWKGRTIFMNLVEEREARVGVLLKTMAALAGGLDPKAAKRLGRVFWRHVWIRSGEC